MSVIVKGMEMPKDCDSCKVGDVVGCSLWKPMDIGERHPDCPLVELPEKHGRLIDADALLALLSGCEVSGSISPLIDVRPTVIEAEGEG